MTAGLESSDVVVLGAGIAGIAAAVALQKVGLKVMVVEARNRIGGRMANSTAAEIACPPGPFDLGAAWVTGLNGNPLVPLCKELGIRFRASRVDGSSDSSSSDDNEPAPDAFHTASGMRVSLDTIDEAETRLPRLFARIRNEFGAPDRSLAEAIRLLTDACANEGQPLTDYDMFLLETNTEQNEGAMLAELSSTGFEPVGGATFGPEYELVEGGFATVPQKWAAREKVDVKLEEPVAVVDWSGEEGVMFKTRQGKVYQAKAAIITAPFPVLRSGSISFNPPLPSQHSAALATFQNGSLTKLFITFPRAFWNPDAPYIALVPSKSEHLEIPDEYLIAAGPIGLSYPGTDSQHVLVAFCCGPVAHRVEQETAIVVREAVAMFRKFYGDSAVPDPSHYFATTWNSDEFSQGAYSFSGLAYDPVAVDRMVEPVGDRILFAGEYTSKLHKGYVHGALLEGQRAAREVAKIVGK